MRASSKSESTRIPMATVSLAPIWTTNLWRMFVTPKLVNVSFSRFEYFLPSTPNSPDVTPSKDEGVEDGTAAPFDIPEPAPATVQATSSSSSSSSSASLASTTSSSSSSQIKRPRLNLRNDRIQADWDGFRQTVLNTMSKASTAVNKHCFKCPGAATLYCSLCRLWLCVVCDDTLHVQQLPFGTLHPRSSFSVDGQMQSQVCQPAANLSTLTLPCGCTELQRSLHGWNETDVNFISLFGRKSVRIRFHLCAQLSVHLVNNRFFPATPTRTRTAFDEHLVLLGHCLHLRAGLSLRKLFNALQRFQQLVVPFNEVMHERDYELWIACVRAYSVIHIAFHYSLHDCGLSVTRAAVPRCIACGTSVHLAHVDGCFSIKRQRCAGTKSERKPVLAESSYLLDASSIESFMQQTDTEERKQSQRRRESKRQRRALEQLEAFGSAPEVRICVSWCVLVSVSVNEMR